jgi:hypothetical protein
MSAIVNSVGYDLRLYVATWLTNRVFVVNVHRCTIRATAIHNKQLVRWSRRTLLLVRLFRLLVLPPLCWTSSAAPLPRELLPAMSDGEGGQAAALRQPNPQLRDGGTMVITIGLRAIGARAATTVKEVAPMMTNGGTENT